MVRATLLAAAMLVTLSGCDILSMAGIGGNESGNASNQAGGAKDPVNQNLQVADAGVTTSRSLQPISANMTEAGDKDPAGAASTFDASLLVGRWGDFGDCTKNIIEFAGDGTFRAANGGTGHWDLDGDRLTFRGSAGEIRVTLEAIDGDRLTVVQADGSRGQSQRC